MNWLDELDKHAARRARMKERHLVPTRADAWSGVDEAHAERLQERERALDVLDLDRDVMQSRPALLQEFLEPLVPFRRDELERRLTIADGKEHRVGLLRRDHFAHGAFEAERALPRLLRCVDVRNANRHVIDTFDSDH